MRIADNLADMQFEKGIFVDAMNARERNPKAAAIAILKYRMLLEMLVEALDEVAEKTGEIGFEVEIEDFMRSVLLGIEDPKTLLRAFALEIGEEPWNPDEYF